MLLFHLLISFTIIIQERAWVSRETTKKKRKRKKFQSERYLKASLRQRPLVGYSGYSVVESGSSTKTEKCQILQPRRSQSRLKKRYD